jgi:hypothetical protein
MRDEIWPISLQTFITQALANMQGENPSKDRLPGVHRRDITANSLPSSPFYFPIIERRAGAPITIEVGDGRLNL